MLLSNLLDQSISLVIFLPFGEILKVSPTAECILGRGKAVRLGAARIKGAPHPKVGIEGRSNDMHRIRYAPRIIENA